MSHDTDILIIGAGAAGLMAGIWAGRTNPRRRILIVDGAKTLGAKILVSGGGRCNVTHDVVTAEAFAGSSRNAIGKVLRRFDVPQVVQFFQEVGVELKREETGKLFPVADTARIVLQALLTAAATANVTIAHPRRVETVQSTEKGFLVTGNWGEINTRKLVLATGGKSLPKSGSDGHGYALAQSLGHNLTPHLWPALVPLTLTPTHFLCGLSGVAAPATLELWSGTQKKMQAFTGSLLCTHFGLSGPVMLDMSRYYLEAQLEDAAAHLTVNWLPSFTSETLESTLLQAGSLSLLRFLREWLPERLARTLLEQAGLEGGTTSGQLTRPRRRTLITALTRLPLPITGHRGFTTAEVTAGGVPLNELDLKTMSSRHCPGLHLCGEICDVDGRIGGYNFQWAWASGYTVGVSV
ncbi:MAG: aminoacetone oxidase family FAD-binding enzyme [Chloroflexi bacterium]|nr:aminoacetone oxidase family FAD-binding enzyme [Chloroflexota bacterium]MBP8054452.1 aminoacetone oxidase family FAD-binding enzyme [Chloroflexota bacterium]